MTQNPNNNITVEESELEGDTITTRAPKAVEKGAKPEGWLITLANPFLVSYEDLVAKYGADTVLEAVRAQFRVKFQSAVRTLAEAGKTDEEIAETMASWKPGDKLGLGGSPEQVILKNFGNMTPEQRAALIQQLSAM